MKYNYINWFYFWMIKYKVTLWTEGLGFHPLLEPVKWKMNWEFRGSVNCFHLFETSKQVCEKSKVGQIHLGHLLMIPILFQYPLLSLKVMNIQYVLKATIIYKTMLLKKSHLLAGKKGIRLHLLFDYLSHVPEKPLTSRTP